MEKIITCYLCNGEMKLYTGPRYNRKIGVFLIVAGGFCTLFWVGAVLGFPLLLLGLYTVGAKRNVWVCEDCNAAMERIELRPRPKGEEAVKKTPAS